MSFGNGQPFDPADPTVDPVYQGCPAWESPALSSIRGDIRGAIGTPRNIQNDGDGARDGTGRRADDEGVFSLCNLRRKLLGSLVMYQIFFDAAAKAAKKKPKKNARSWGDNARCSATWTGR